MTFRRIAGEEEVVVEDPNFDRKLDLITAGGSGSFYPCSDFPKICTYATTSDQTLTTLLLLRLTVMIYTTRLLSSYIYYAYTAKGMKKEYHKPMPMKGKEELTSVLSSCFTCEATLDLKLLESFGSRRLISDDGKSYYCNNPLCPTDEEERKRRLLPFSGNNHHHNDHHHM